MRFVSSKASFEGYFEDDATILGPSFIGEGTLIGSWVIVGYPIEKMLRSISHSVKAAVKEYDRLSKGSKIGRNCIIRSGTVVYETVQIADKVRTGHNALIREGSIIGQETLIGSSAKLDGEVNVGKRVKIQSNAYLPHLTKIEDDVFIAPNVCLTNDPYPISRRLSGITIEKNAIIGANTTIIPGTIIGRNAVVGAGSVVTKDVPADNVVVGCPARYHMKRDEFDRKRRIWEKARSEDSEIET